MVFFFIAGGITAARPLRRSSYVAPRCCLLALVAPYAKQLARMYIPPDSFYLG